VRTTLLSTVRAALVRVGTDRGLCAYWVPGRVEVLGKHTDYAGGRSLVCAAEQGFVAAAVPRHDAAVRVMNVATGAEFALGLDPELGQPPDAWMRYPATVLRRVARNFPAARQGADLAFLSTLPLASGMSSSSAFMVAVFLAIADINHLAADEAYRQAIGTPEELAAYLATIENGLSFGALTGDRGVGTFGGSEDHTAMLCCRAGELSQYSFCPVRHERQVPCPSDRRFVVAVSGVKAEKTGAAKDAYNRASLAVRAILDAWHAASGRPDRSLAEAVDRGGAAQVRDVIERTAIDGFPTAVVLDRFDQFVEESVRIVPAAAEALERREFGTFGVLVDRSQQLAERLLHNQVPETILLARSARELGADAASAFGAGFGGSVWALVPDATVDTFVRKWEAAYRAAFPSASPAFLVTRPGPAASRIWPDADERIWSDGWTAEDGNRRVAY
jgi:galactokinase